MSLSLSSIYMSIYKYVHSISFCLLISLSSQSLYDCRCISISISHRIHACVYVSACHPLYLISADLCLVHEDLLPSSLDATTGDIWTFRAIREPDRRLQRDNAVFPPAQNAGLSSFKAKLAFATSFVIFKNLPEQTPRTELRGITLMAIS